MELSPAQRALIDSNRQRALERKKYHAQKKQEDEAENDVATSAEAPPRLDGGNGGKNGKTSRFGGD